MIAVIYGLQALVFIMRAKWDMVAWMIFYILALPVFTLFLPLYSFWRMDDFSWGATRVVLGESGKKIIVHVSSTSCFSWDYTEPSSRMKANSILAQYRSNPGATM